MSAKKLSPVLSGPDHFDALRGFKVFANCSDGFIRSFASVAELREAPSSQTILLEGKENKELLILASGSVEVLVDGENVAVLETPGDLMGEISVFTDRNATASIIASTEVTYFSISITELDKFVLASKDDFGYQLFRALTSVLSGKIIRTNDKARRFEMANRALSDALKSLEESNRNLDQKVKDRTSALLKKTDELQNSYLALESQNAELLASHRKLEELYSSKDMTFKRLNELQSLYLSPLMETMKELEKGVGADEQVRIDRAKSQIESSIEMLRPMSELYSTEQAIRSRRVLLAERDRKQQVISKLALSGSGARLDLASTAEEALELLHKGTRYDLVFVSSDLAALIPEIRKLAPQAKLVFMASSNVPAELPVLKEHAHLISNIVSRHPEDRTFTVKNVATTVSKLVSKDVFGLEKYMFWGVEVQTKTITGSDERKDLIADMQDHVAKLGVRSNISDRMALVAEELLMNAIYDAPTSSDGRTKYNHLPRTQSVHLQGPEQGRLRYACDGMLAALSVSDPFGGFKMSTLLDYLSRNYQTNGEEVQDSGKGGAGRGLHQIIENSDLVVFNVQKNIRTEIIAFFNLDLRSVVDGAKPSFHFFFE